MVGTAAGAGKVTIYGYDWNDRLMSEEITIPGAGTFHALTKKWFQEITSISWNGAAAITSVGIYPWDVKIQTGVPSGLTIW